MHFFKLLWLRDLSSNVLFCLGFTVTSPPRQPEQMDQPPLAEGLLGLLCCAWGKTSSHILSQNRMKDTSLRTALLQCLGGKECTQVLKGSTPRLWHVEPCSGCVTIELRARASILVWRCWGWTASKENCHYGKTVKAEKAELPWFSFYPIFSSCGSLTEILPRACRLSPRVLAAAPECYKLPTPLLLQLSTP